MASERCSSGSGLSMRWPETALKPPKVSSETRTDQAGPTFNISSLKGIDRKLAVNILDEVVDSAPGVSFDDISGLKEVKEALREAIILPSLRPDLFTGIRSPPRGILLFGPPGNGKTLLVGASGDLADGGVGSGSGTDGETTTTTTTMMMMMMMGWWLCRGALRRLKTEFLVQFDGLGTVSLLASLSSPAPSPRPYDVLQSKDSRIVVIAATNRPQIANVTQGFTGSDITAMCKDAAMGPIRDLRGGIEKVGWHELACGGMRADRGERQRWEMPSGVWEDFVNESSVRGISIKDLREAAEKTRPSVSNNLLRVSIALPGLASWAHSFDRTYWHGTLSLEATKFEGSFWQPGSPLYRIVNM
eukprot:748328-Hanusia_phi.AAC.5